MRRYFAILSLVLISLALGAKSFIPFAEFDHHDHPFQLGLVEGLEVESELGEGEYQDDKVKFDGPQLDGVYVSDVQLGLLPDRQACTVLESHRGAFAPHCKPYLLFGVLRL